MSERNKGGTKRQRLRPLPFTCYSLLFTFFSRLFDGKSLLADAVFASFREHLPNKLFLHVDQGAFFVDVNLANRVAGDFGMIGNRADHIGWANAVHLAHAHRQTDHAGFVGGPAQLGAGETFTAARAGMSWAFETRFFAAAKSAFFRVGSTFL